MTEPGLEPAGPDAAWPDPVDGRPDKWAEIDLSALRDNARGMAGHLGAGVEMIAMVKANGYGHGAILAARAFLAGGATRLGVSSSAEALQLRTAGIEQPILVTGWTDPEAHRALLAAGIELALHDGAAIPALATAADASGRPAQVHLKVETGMNRLGIRSEDLSDVLATLAARPGLEVRAVFTHFADADGPDPGPTEAQHRRFLPMVAAIRALAPDALVHCSNSAAALRFPGMHHDAVRPGIALYGYPPVAAPAGLRFRPAMTVAARVTQVKRLGPTDSVGYGGTWTADRPAAVASVAAGYADGVHRSQSNIGVVLIGGVRCPIVGRVSMDQLSVDVSHLETVEPGQSAVLVGGRDGAVLGADEVAAAAGTIAYEVLCAVSARVVRLVRR